MNWIAAIPELLNRLVGILRRSGDYSQALVTGYVLTAANIAAQILLTPFYIERLGSGQFGILMMILNFVNFAAIGITWMSGGLTRVMGERWAAQDKQGTAQAYSLGKVVFVAYAILLSGVGIGLWWGLSAEHNIPSWLLWGLVYLLVLYESNPDRQAFVALCWQGIGNSIEIVRVIVFVVATLGLLSVHASLDSVLLAYVFAFLVQRIILATQLYRVAPELKFRFPRADSMALFRRLAGQQGFQYVFYGALLLGMQADMLILGFLSGPDAVAKFAVLWKIPEAFSLILWRIPSAIEPHVVRMDARGDMEGVHRSFFTGRRRFVAICLGVALFYALFGKQITQLWVGEFAPQDNWMYWLSAVALFFLSIARWPISFAYAMIRLRPLIAIGLIELGGKFAVMVLLLPYLSYAAPVAGTAIVHIFVVSWAYQFLFRRRTTSLQLP